MSNLEHTTSWQQIQQGVKEAERLIVNKNYNLVMVKARQTLECMVRCMAEKACLVEGDLSDTIDQLYEGGWINKTTKDNYHTIRILGNKAVHENVVAYSSSSIALSRIPFAVFALGCCKSKSTSSTVRIPGIFFSIFGAFKVSAGFSFHPLF